MCRSSLLATYCLRWRCTDASIHPHSYVRRVLEPRRSAQMSPILRASCSMISELWDPKGSSKGVAARPGGLLCSSAECRLGGNGVPDILRALIDMCGASKRLGFGVSPRRRDQAIDDGDKETQVGRWPAATTNERSPGVRWADLADSVVGWMRYSSFRVVLLPGSRAARYPNTVWPAGETAR